MEFLSREVKQIVNKLGDEIELEIFQYPNEYYVVATICQDHPPFIDCFSFGSDLRRKKAAIRKALRDLYLQAYPDLFQKS